MKCLCDSLPTTAHSVHPQSASLITICKNSGNMIGGNIHSRRWPRLLQSSHRQRTAICPLIPVPAALLNASSKIEIAAKTAMTHVCLPTSTLRLLQCDRPQDQQMRPQPLPGNISGNISGNITQGEIHNAPYTTKAHSSRSARNRNRPRGTANSGAGDGTRTRDALLGSKIGLSAVASPENTGIEQ